MYRERLVINREGVPMVRGFNKTKCYFRYLGFWDYIFYAPDLLALTIIDIFY